MTAPAGMSMTAKMSTRERRIVSEPIRRMAIASTTKV
jgi:hypothetical protein